MNPARPTMLDTNAASVLIRGGAASISLQRLLGADLCISVITEAELRFGLARQLEATRLSAAVQAFLQTVQVLPWTSAAAAVYGPLRVQMAVAGASLSAMDLLIAAHALTERCVLATADRGFGRVPGLALLDWQSVAD